MATTAQNILSIPQNFTSHTSVSGGQSLHQVLAAVDAFILFLDLRRICARKNLDVVLKVGVTKVPRDHQIMRAA